MTNLYDDGDDDAVRNKASLAINQCQRDGCVRNVAEHLVIIHLLLPPYILIIILNVFLIAFSEAITWKLRKLDCRKLDCWSAASRASSPGTACA